jgi:type IV fimbrial biogenesis protein FimT
MFASLEPRKAQFVKGFTLVELMVTISIAAIILAIAIPSFTRFMDDNAIRGACEELRNSLSLARNEGIRGSRLVHVAPSCTGKDWSDGWAVFTDGGSTADCFDDADGLIMRTNALSRNVKIKFENSSVVSTYIAYNGSGVSRASNNSLLFGTFECKITSSEASPRTLTVNSFGRVR